MRRTPSEVKGSLARMLRGWDEAAALDEYAKSYSTAQRKQLAKEGKALSDGSYPINDAGDLKNALTLARSGHGNVSGAMALIKRRAKALGVKLDEKAIAEITVGP